MTYDNNNTGSLFKNEHKKEGTKQPDYKGNAEINGVKLEVAGWIRTSKKSGIKFISLTFQPPFKKADPGAFVPPPPKASEADDEVPF